MTAHVKVRDLSLNQCIPDIDLSDQLGPHTHLSRSIRSFAKESGGERRAYQALDQSFREALTGYMKLRTLSQTEELYEALSQEQGGDLPTRAQVNQSLIASMARRAQIARSEEDILEEINTDIEIYSELLIELLVPHLNLEKAFYERFINQINAMTGHSSVYDHKADALINDWLRTDVKKIKHRAFAQLDAMRAEHTSKQKLYEAIVSLIGAWQEKYARL